jgi:hypothetical protein
MCLSLVHIAAESHKQVIAGLHSTRRTMAGMGMNIPDISLNFSGDFIEIKAFPGYYFPIYK